MRPDQLGLCGDVLPYGGRLKLGIRDVHLDQVADQLHNSRKLLDDPLHERDEDVAGGDDSALPEPAGVAADD